MVQCARIAFGLSGIFDPDEATRIKNNIQKTRNKKATHESYGHGVESIKQIINTKDN
jgi:hypothetical protein